MYRNREEKTLQHAFHANFKFKCVLYAPILTKKLPNSILNGAYQLYLKALIDFTKEAILIKIMLCNMRFVCFCDERPCMLQHI